MRRIIIAMMAMIFIMAPKNMVAQDVTPPMTAVTHVIGGDGQVTWFAVIPESGLVEIAYADHAASLDVFAAIEQVNATLVKNNIPITLTKQARKIETEPGTEFPSEMYIKGTDGKWYRVRIEPVGTTAAPMSPKAARMNQ